MFVLLPKVIVSFVKTTNIVFYFALLSSRTALTCISNNDDHKWICDFLCAG